MQEPLSFESLYRSAQKCKRGVIWKDSVAAFSLDGLARVVKLQDAIANGTYVSRPPHHFRLTYPKQREAASICFRDRVYQRSLNDNVIYPALTKSFIYDNGACQLKKGTDFTRNRLKAHLQKAYRRWGTDFYILQCDIKGYYANMDHATVEDYFRKHIPAPYAEKAIQTLREQYPSGVGYSPGSQMLQLAGIAMLNPLDHFIKEKLRVKHYIRYMDDFLLFHSDRRFLEECQEQIAQELTKCKMELHPNKTKISPISQGFYFLGFDWRITPTGRVLLHLPSQSVKRERKHLKGMFHKGLPQEKIEESFRSWTAFAQKGSTRQLTERMQFLCSCYNVGNEPSRR